MIMNFAIKSDLIKKYGLLMFKQKCYILSYKTNTQREINVDFGLHKVIFMLI